MTAIDLLGGVTAVLTTAAFLPQAVMMLRTRDTSSISLVMYAMFLTGVAGWFFFGLMIMSWPMLCANAITFALAAMIFVVKTQNTLDERRSDKALPAAG